MIGRALRHRNYQLFFAGQGISLIGTWLTRFAMGLYTFQLSHSELALGVVAFASQAPNALIGPFAGVLVDRWDRHRTLVWTQVVATLQSATLAAFALTDTMTVPLLACLGAMQGVISAFRQPAHQSMLRRFVEDRADLANAIALDSALFNSTRLIGPLVATLLVHLVGIGWCFAIDAASYVAVIASLLAMRLAPPPAVPPSGKRVAHELREGLAHICRMPVVRGLFILLAGISTFGGAYLSLLPAVAEGSDALGWMMGAGGAGAVVAVLYLAARRDTLGLDRFANASAYALGAGLIMLPLAPNVWATVPLFFVVGGGLIALWTAVNTYVQSVVDDDKLGRVTSLLASTFFAAAPIGALLEGALASAIGAIHALALAGVGCIAFAAWFTVRVRRASP